MSKRKLTSRETREPWELDPDLHRNQQQAGKELAAWFVRLYSKGLLSATEVCIGSWWASKAGAVGKVDTYGLNQGSQSGHFQRHLDAVFPYSEPAIEPCLVDLVIHSKSAGRVKRPTRFKPVHECLAAEVVQLD